MSATFRSKRWSSGRFSGLGLENVEAFGEGLHHAVLDAVVNHLHEMPGTRRAGVDVAVLGAVIIGLRSLVRGMSPMPGARRRTADRGAHGLGIAADHHAVTALQAPDAAGSADVDVVQAFFRQGFGAADVVLIEGVAAVDDGIAGFQQFAQGVDGVFGRVACRQHDPDGAWLGQAGDQGRQIGNAGGALLAQASTKAVLRS
jgi:hypothetical protein